MKKIIVCVDDTSESASVTAFAAWAAQQMKVPLEFLHVLDRHPEVAEDGDYSGNLVADSRENLLRKLSDKDVERSRRAREKGRALLETVKAQARAAGVMDPDGRLRHGSLVEALTERADDIEMVVMGHRHHTDKLRLDHTIETVIRSLNCPLLSSMGEFREPKRVMLAFDGSPEGRSKIERYARHPLVGSLECHVVMACDRISPLVEKMLAWAMNTLTTQGVSTVTNALVGEPIEVLRDYSRTHSIDLMVTGAFRHSILRQLLFGSTTIKLLRTSLVPVLVLR